MPATELALLEAAARAAGAIALRHFATGVSASEKPDGSGPVTEADIEIDRMLQDRLLAARPGYGWLSEETPDGVGRLERERQFIVDPIDGTRAFVAGSDDWAHSLAIAERGRIIAAVVYLPRKGQLYSAGLGTGAHLDGRAIAVAGPKPAGQARLLAARPNYEPQHWAAGAPPDIARHFRSSLAWRLCLVADGQFDAMMTLRPAWEWDIAAGALIVTEAGGRATDRTGRALRFNNPHPQTDGVIAGGSLHGEIVSHLA